MDFLLDQNNLIFLAVAVVSGVLLMLPNLFKGGDKAISAQKAVQLTNQQDGLFVDVRSHEAFKTGSIPQARHLPAADLQAKLGSLPKDKPIIVFCDQGRDSARVASTLRKQGYDQAYSLEGGLNAWTQGGLPLAKKH